MITVLASLLISLSAIYANEPLPSAIHLKSRLIDTNHEPKAEYFQALDDEPSDLSEDPLGLHLLQLNSALAPAETHAFEQQHGIVILYYVPDNAYVIRCKLSIALQLSHLNEVHWIGPLLPSDKYSPDIGFPLELNDLEFASLCVIAMHVVKDGVRLSKILQEALQPQVVKVRVASKDRIEVCFEATVQMYNAVLDTLAIRNEVVYLYRVPFRQKLNKYADQIIRYGNQRADLTTASLSQLSGAGQVIGCGDTGLDPDHCFFHDPARPIPYVHYASNTVPEDSFDPFHRKIVQYVTYTEQMSIQDGHGTHVAGTLVGKPWDYNPNSLRHIDEFSGIAMDAKLAFFDISEKEVLNGLNIPKVLDKSYFGWAYAAGARLHSNSWGSPTTLYNIDAFDVDKYSWDHKDFLPIFAAGNNGTSGEMQISSPGNAKNALSVGSSVSPIQSFQEVFCESGFSPNYYVCQQAHSKKQHLTENDIAFFSSMGPTVDGRIKPDVVAPGYYIYSAKNAPDQAESCELEISKLLLAHAGTSMSAPVVASTLALARQYFMEGYYPAGSRGTGTPFSPSAALLKSVAIAGAVSLTGFRDYGSQFVHNYRPLSPAPNFVQGFGRTQLDSVLKFAGLSRFDMIIAGYKDGELHQDPEFDAPGQYHEYKVCILGNSKKYLPRFTLVWTDYPAVPLSAVAIVNDLDLQARYETSSSPSNNTRPSELIYPNGSDAPDRVNTVERIELTDTQLSDVVIVRVTASSLHHAPQPYSLLITGQVAVIKMHESCQKVAHRKFAVDPVDLNESLRSSSSWRDVISNNMFLLGALVCAIIVCLIICFRLMTLECNKSVKRQLAPDDAAVLAASNLSLP